MDEVLSWLPTDTETIQGAQGPFKVGSESSYDLRALLQIKAYPAYGEKSGKDLLQTLKGRSISLSVEGSRHFRSPAGLGSMPFEGCRVVVFSQPLGSAGDRFMAAAKSKATALFTVEGLQVALLKERLENDIWSFYYALPAADTLVMATNESYLREVLKRMKSHPTDRALPATSPEWRYIDRSARFWALRHFDRSQSAEDPSSPFDEEKAANSHDDQAIGVAFFLDASGRGIVTYLSQNSNSEAVAKKFWDHPDDGLRPTFSRVDAGAVRITAKPRGDALGIFSLVLDTVFGHGTFL